MKLKQSIEFTILPTNKTHQPVIMNLEDYIQEILTTYSFQPMMQKNRMKITKQQVK